MKAILNTEVTKLCVCEQFVFKETLQKVIDHCGHWTKSRFAKKEEALLYILLYRQLHAQRKIRQNVGEHPVNID